MQNSHPPTLRPPNKGSVLFESPAASPSSDGAGARTTPKADNRLRRRRLASRTRKAIVERHTSGARAPHQIEAIGSTATPRRGGRGRPDLARALDTVKFVGRNPPAASRTANLIVRVPDWATGHLPQPGEPGLQGHPDGKAQSNHDPPGLPALGRIESPSVRDKGRTHYLCWSINSPRLLSKVYLKWLRKFKPSKPRSLRWLVKTRALRL